MSKAKAFIRIQNTFLLSRYVKVDPVALESEPENFERCNTVKFRDNYWVEFFADTIRKRFCEKWVGDPNGN